MRPSWRTAARLEPPLRHVHRREHIDAGPDVLVDGRQYRVGHLAHPCMMVLTRLLHESHVVGIQVHRIGERQGFVVKRVDVTPETATGVSDPAHKDNHRVARRMAIARDTVEVEAMLAWRAISL